ncbi:MAG: YbhB/YbcL family Raf kinase inhibitor-like protein, partial [Candidatus Levyibacteriota bacterium]
MKLTSVAFQNNQSIPQQFTCEGRGSNPALQISDVPSSAKSLVLIMDDPDTAMGVFLHWVLFNIPATTTEIKENSIPQGCLQGKNGIGKTGYIGPCPPTGEHHY